MTHKRMLINNEIKYGYSIHKVTKYLDDGEILSQNQKNIYTSSENELSFNHKQLEHQRSIQRFSKFFKLTLNQKKRIQFLFLHYHQSHCHEQN